MTMRIALIVLAVALMVGGWMAYGYATADGCCGNPEAECCPLKKK